MPISECGASTVAGSVSSVGTALWLNRNGKTRCPDMPAPSADQSKTALEGLAHHHEIILKRSAEEWQRQQARDAKRAADAAEAAKRAAIAEDEDVVMPPPPPKRRRVERDFHKESSELKTMFCNIESVFKQTVADKDSQTTQIKEFEVPATASKEDADHIATAAMNTAECIHNYVLGNDTEHRAFIGMDFIGMIQGRMSCGCPIQSNGTVDHMAPNCCVWVDELCDLEARPLIDYLLHAIKKALNVKNKRLIFPAHLRQHMPPEEDPMANHMSLAASMAKIIIIAMRTHHHLVKCGASMFIPYMLLVSQANVESEWQRYASKIMGYFIPASIQERFPDLKDELVDIARDTERAVREHPFWQEHDHGNQSRGVLNKQVRVLEFLASGIVSVGEGKHMRAIQTCEFDAEVCPLVASKEGGMNCDPWKVGVASVRRQVDSTSVFRTVVPGLMSPMAHKNLSALMACGGTGVNTTALEFLRTLLNKDAETFDIGDVLCTSRGVRYMSSATRRMDLLRRIASALRPTTTSYDGQPPTTCLLGPMTMDPIQMLHVIVRTFDRIIVNVPASLVGMRTNRDSGSAPIRTTAHLNRGVGGPAPSTVKALGDAASAIVTVSSIVCFAIHTLRHHAKATPRVAETKTKEVVETAPETTESFRFPVITSGALDEAADIGLPVDELPPREGPVEPPRRCAASVCESVAGTTITGLAEAWKRATQ